MVDTVANSEQILLTYKDVVEAHPEWGDQAVEDYLATKRDIVDATETADKAVDTSNSSVLVPALIQRLEDLENARPINYGQIALGQIGDLSFDVVVVTSNYTTTGNEIVICNNTTPIEITLNLTPKDREAVHVVKQNTGSVNVIGTALGDTSLTIGTRYSSPHFTYIQEISSWVVL